MKLIFRRIYNFGYLNKISLFIFFAYLGSYSFYLIHHDDNKNTCSLQIDHSCCFHAANTHQNHHNQTNKDFGNHNYSLENSETDFEFSQQKHIFELSSNFNAFFKLNQYTRFFNFNPSSKIESQPLYTMYCNWKFHLG